MPKLLCNVFKISGGANAPNATPLVARLVVLVPQFGNHCFTVFVLTLQTGFVARWCFWFSANDSSIKQVCRPLVYTMCKKA